MEYGTAGYLFASSCRHTIIKQRIEILLHELCAGLSEHELCAFPDDVTDD